MLGVVLIRRNNIKSRNKIERIGEVNYNEFGSKMIITRYKNCENINVFFPEYNCTVNGIKYDNFKRGETKCPYEKRTCGVGYLGEGKYKVWENSRQIRVYHTWVNMLMRCYDDKFHEKHSTYIECETSEIFHNFQNFGAWDSENFYIVEGETMCLDKDILVKGNKIYSPDTCIYVPQTINNSFTTSDKKEETIQ